MNRIFIMLLSVMVLLTVAPSCRKSNHDAPVDLWNDMVIEDELYHFKQIAFKNNTDIVCQGDPSGLATLRLTMPDGTAVGRVFMLSRPEGYQAQFDLPQGQLSLIVQEIAPLNGDYRGIAGSVTVQRQAFKTIITMDSLRLLRVGTDSDTLSVAKGYLSYDLTLFE